MPRALFIRHHLEDNPGLIGDAFRTRGYEIAIAMMDESSPTPSLDGVDVLVILGSKSAVYDPRVEEAWFGRELSLMGDAAANAIPILGICFGAQALCRFHGGAVEASGAPEIGWYDVEPIGDSPIVSGPWFEFHFDRCILPDVATPWARTSDAVQAFVVGRDVGVQFHPEVDEAQLRDWFEAGDEVPRELGSKEELLARTAHETPNARVRAATLVDIFLRHAFV